jgi:hypothetical protein
MDVLQEAHEEAKRIFASAQPEYWYRTVEMVRVVNSGRVFDAVYDAMHAGARFSLDNRAEEAVYIHYTAGALYALVAATLESKRCNSTAK